MVEDDDDSDYGHSKKRSKKVIRRGRPDKKEKKSPKPRLKATGKAVCTRHSSPCLVKARPGAGHSGTEVKHQTVAPPEQSGFIPDHVWAAVK